MSTRRLLILGLVLANLAVHMGGSEMSVRADFGTSDAQDILDKLQIKNLDKATTDRILRQTRRASLVEDAKNRLGISGEDIDKLDAGFLVVPDEGGQSYGFTGSQTDGLTPLQIEQRVTALKEEVKKARARTVQSAEMATDAKGAQQYLDGVHEKYKDSYDQALKQSQKNLKDQIQQVTTYLRKFPSIATACT